MSETKRRRWPFVLGGVALALAVFLAVFRWDWLVPLVNTQASKALGRPVTVTHLHVRLGWVPHIEVEGVTIANPDNWPGGGTFATADRLSVDIDALAYVRSRAIVIPDIAIDHPQVDAQQLEDGQANWNLAGGGSSSTGPGPKIGNLRISDGHAHVVMAKLKSDFNVDVATKEAEGQPSQIVASAKGTYAKAPIDATFTGGALLSLRDESQPYPINLQVANGPTKISLVGTVQDPLAFAGANLKLDLSGPDMSLLLPLTGVAIPKTPPYRITGGLDYADGAVKFTGMNGKVGSSDLGGDLQVDTKPQRPVLTADLRSKRVDLKDLGGFIGADPGDASKGTKKPAPAAGPSNGRVLPNDPVSLPKLNVADVHLKYHADRIEGRSQPLDNMQANLDIVDGAVSLSPLSFGIGHGQIVSDIKLAQSGQGVHAKTTVDFQRVDVDKLLTAAGVGKGAGSIGGRAVIDGTGRSMAEILAHGNGELKLYMGSGGDLSALLVDLSGLEFGNALLSALGIPNRAKIQCLITDFVLQQGLVDARTVLLDTDAARVGGKGDINLRDESLKLVLNTDSKHFSIGSLPAPVDITGTFGKPSVMPDLAVIGARAGAAVGLGILLTPLGALLPTIQLGTGEDGACAGLLASAKAPPAVPPRAPARAKARR